MRLSSLRSRVEKLEGRSRGDDLLIINVTGGLPPPAPLHASFNHQYVSQEDGEDEQTFRERAIAAAEAARAKIVVISTFPPREPWEHEVPALPLRGEPEASWDGAEP
jgi:hypothetical protein